MAGSPVGPDWRPSRPPSKEGNPSHPESSLSWCLAHLHKPGPCPETPVDGGGGRDTDKRFRASQWRALVAIRTQHIKAGKAGIAKLRNYGGLKPLIGLLNEPECSRKTLDLALSILANCCTEQETCREVRKLDGINVVVEIMKRNVGLETVLNRAARALGNMATEAESSALIHSAGGVPLLLVCLSFSAAPSSSPAPPSDSCPKLECAQSAARALLYLSTSPSSRLSIITQGTLSALAPLIAPEYPQGLRRAALRTIHELTRGCGPECAREVSRSGVLSQLGVLASGESGETWEELALKTLANLCSQACLRPLVGSLGVIPKFAEEAKSDPMRSGVFLKALCLCCKEAVNRAKVKESGGLEALTRFLSSQPNHPLARLAVLACVDFVFDESAMEQLQELGLVPLLIARLVRITRGGQEEEASERTDGSSSSGMSPKELLSSPTLDSLDYPPPEGSRKEDGGREQGSSSFLSLRSWLLSEGLISSEGELLDSSVDADYGSLQLPSCSSSSESFSPNPYSSPSLRSVCSSKSTGCKPAVQLSPASSSSLSAEALVELETASTCSSSSSSTSSSKTSVSPSKFSSPQKRRRLSSASPLTKVSLDSPPSVPRSAAYQHPYHPEPWTPESPVLLLLSRFSHSSDPSAALVSSAVVSGLLYYLTRHQDPSSRCFRLLCRLSCNPNCLEALLRTGAVALIRHHLCRSEAAGAERQPERVKAKVRQLGATLLNNLRVQCESGFGSGVLAHVMLSGSELDRMNCALSLPFISSNKALLKKLLLDSGGLLLALQPLGCESDEDNDDENDDDDEECERPLIDPSRAAPHPPPRSVYASLLIGCLSSLTPSAKPEETSPTPPPRELDGCVDESCPPPPQKKPHLGEACPYGESEYDLLLLLDDGSRVPVSKQAVSGVEEAEEAEEKREKEDDAHSQYFRALLTGGFGEGSGQEEIRIRDASAGMLLPVVHFLHGCRFGERGGLRQCQMLDALVTKGLRMDQLLTGNLAFQDTPLGEMMVGAGRFLVGGLQRLLEDVCVSALLSSPAPQGRFGSDLTAGDAEGTKPDVESPEGTAPEPSSEESPEESVAPGSPPRRPDRALASLLPHLYWFSQRYNYPALGRACLSVLLGAHAPTRPLFAHYATGLCLRRLARGADCTDSLKRDLLGLVTAALS